MTELLSFKKALTEINENIQSACNKVGRDSNEIKVIAVSKTHPADMVQTAMEAGFVDFGENYVQELMQKDEFFKNSVIKPVWHYIGHLQTNKVKFISPFVSMIHSCGSEKLALEISKNAVKNNITTKVLLQLNTSGEPQKSGCNPDEAVELAGKMLEIPNIELLGGMTIGTFTDDETLQRAEFSLLRRTIEEVNRQLGVNLKELSMGMTSDYPIAIQEGATYVRVGTAIFGDREYNQK